jgi:hypothetical protein
MAHETSYFVQAFNAGRGGSLAALAEALVVHFSGISQDHCLVHRLRALISRGIPLASSRAATARSFSSLANDDEVRSVARTSCLPELIVRVCERTTIE